MTNEAAIADAAEPLTIGEAAPKARATIFGYIGALVFILPLTGVVGTSIDFLLKDDLHLSPDAIAGFYFIVTIPAYFGFVFGFIRDRWAPFGRRDQGLLILFSALSVLTFIYLAGARTTLLGLTVIILVRGVIGQFLGAAQRGLTSTLGKEHVMTGRLAAVWQAVGGLPGLFVTLVGGYLADRFVPRQVFLICAFIALGIFAFSWIRPRAVYEDPAESETIPKRHFGADVARLLKTPAIYPCVILLFLWNFTPGVGTPMLFYLRDTLHASKLQYAEFNAVFNGFFIPTFLLHGFLCTRVRLHTILWISTMFAVPQILPLMFIHSAASALWVGVPMGLMGGFATAAYYDLLIRACPAGLQGTVMMLGSSVWVLSGELGNVAGAKIYNMGGFPLCAYSTVVVYACLIPVLLFVPKHLTATRDGEVLNLEP